SSAKARAAAPTPGEPRCAARGRPPAAPYACRVVRQSILAGSTSAPLSAGMTVRRPLSCVSAGQLPREIPAELLQDVLGRRTLCVDEAKVSMGVLGLTDDSFIAERMFEVFDQNGDGLLCFSEFSSSLGVMLKGTEDQKLKLSFDMVAGRKAWIAKADFKNLVSACNAAKASMAVPQDGLTREDEVERLFEELAAHCGEVQDGEPVLTLDGYKWAAETNEDFLSCLGLSQPASFRRSTSCGHQARGGAAELGPAHAAVPLETLGELQQRIEALSRMVRDAREDLQLQQLRSVVASMSQEQPWPPCESEPSEAAEPARWPPPAAEEGPPALSVRKLLSTTVAVEKLFSGVLSLCAPPSLDAADQVHEVVAVSPARQDDEEDLGPASPRPEGKFLETVAHELDGILGLCNQCHGKPPAPQARGGRAGLGALPALGPPSALTPRAAASQRVTATASAAEGGGAPGPRHPLAVHRVQSRRMPTLTQPVAHHHLKRHRVLGPRKGLAVHFGHENWNMVVSMMIGIRLSIGRARGERRREMQPVDFSMKEKFTIAPRYANIFDSTASPRAIKYRFIDYAPMVFQRIRLSFGIDTDEYLHSVGPEQLLGNMILGNLSSLSEQTSEGKSGAFFYYTADGKYMLKTVSKAEYRTLRRMLREYYDHLQNNPQTMLVRFLGLHCLSVMEQLRGTETMLHSTQKMYFVVMANMFNTPVEIHRKYDLKGSWVGRSTDQANPEQAVLKDVDFRDAQEQLLVGADAARALAAQLEADTKFLCESQVIDYSLLVGIHEVDRVSPEISCERDGGVRDLRRAPSTESAAALLGGELHVDSLPLHQRHLGGILSSDRKFLYFMGVIDMFKTYDAKAKVEHHAKALVYERAGVSCCSPEMYRSRFMAFMRTAMA
ncbi:unnamed protein product, partial [Prorocentrum cordatum]